MVESIAASVIDKALEAVLRKVSEGKKLSTEDLVVLMLGLFREVRKEVVDVRNEIAETNKRINAINDTLIKRIEETNKRIDALYDLVGRNYEALRNEIAEVRKEVADLRNDVNRRIDETNKRIDTLYELMGKIYEALIKQEIARKQ